MNRKTTFETVTIATIAVAVLLTAGAASAGPRPDTYPSVSPILSLSGSLSARGELTESETSASSGAGATAGVAVWFSKEVAWVTSLGARARFLPEVELADVTVRSGVRWLPLDWFALEGNALLDVYPTVRPGIEAVARVTTPGPVGVFAEIRVPIRFVAPDPIDVVVGGGVNIGF